MEIPNFLHTIIHFSANYKRRQDQRP